MVRVKDVPPQLSVSHWQTSRDGWCYHSPWRRLSQAKCDPGSICEETGRSSQKCYWAVSDAKLSKRRRYQSCCWLDDVLCSSRLTSCLWPRHRKIGTLWRPTGLLVPPLAITAKRCISLQLMRNTSPLKANHISFKLFSQQQISLFQMKEKTHLSSMPRPLCACTVHSHRAFVG